MGVETNRQFHYFHEIVDRIKMLYTLHPPLISPKRAIKDSARQCCSAASQGGRHWNASNSVTNDCALCSRYKKVHASQRTVLKHKVVFEWLYLPLVLSLSHTHIPSLHNLTANDLYTKPIWDLVWALHVKLTQGSYISHNTPEVTFL